MRDDAWFYLKLTFRAVIVPRKRFTLSHKVWFFSKVLLYIFGIYSAGWYFNDLWSWLTVWKVTAYRTSVRYWWFVIINVCGPIFYPTPPLISQLLAIYLLVTDRESMTSTYLLERYINIHDYIIHNAWSIHIDWIQHLFCRSLLFIIAG